MAETDAVQEDAPATVSEGTANKYPGLRPWKPGQSGNPSGRPKRVRQLTDIADAAAQAAMRKVVKLMDSDDDRVALAAAREVLDRVAGKPRQAVDVTQGRDAADYTEAELVAIARLGRAGADTAAEGKAEPGGLH